MNAAVVELFDGVDDLIRRVAHTESPEIRKTRARVHAALVVAKNAFEAKPSPAPSQSVQVAEPEEPAVDAPESAKSSLDPYPTPFLGVALLVGLGFGLLLRQ